MGADTVVIDASTAIKAALVDRGFDLLRALTLVAPTLMWSEAAAALRQLEWRAEISSDEGRMALDRIVGAEIEGVPSSGLVGEASSIARQLGWAKTYDAEYVALARRLESRLLTVDARLRRSVSSLIEVVGPTEL